MTLRIALNHLLHTTHVVGERLLGMLRVCANVHRWMTRTVAVRIHPQDRRRPRFSY